MARSKRPVGEFVGEFAGGLFDVGAGNDPDTLRTLHKIVLKLFSRYTENIVVVSTLPVPIAYNHDTFLH